MNLVNIIMHKYTEDIRSIPTHDSVAYLGGYFSSTEHRPKTSVYYEVHYQIYGYYQRVPTSTDGIIVRYIPSYEYSDPKFTTEEFEIHTIDGCGCGCAAPAKGRITKVLKLSSESCVDLPLMQSRRHSV
jgi:hypothetical protein